MELGDRLASIRARIGDATLVAVSKEQPDESVRALYALGVHDFGENKVQALEGRIERLSDLAIRWHLIGPVQSNKAKDVARLAAAGSLALLHTIDRGALVSALAMRLDPLKPLPCLIQVDIDQEPQKAGVALADLEGLIDLIAATPALTLRGLMAIPRPLAEVGEARLARSFDAMRLLAEQHRARFVGPAILSMGMSDDFALAIARGATHVRVGTALFGPRSPRPKHP